MNCQNSVLITCLMTEEQHATWSAGSSNSQDSFPAPGSSGTSMDGYGYGYPPGSTPDYSSPPMQRPASQTNAPSPHPGKSGGLVYVSCYIYYWCWNRFVVWRRGFECHDQGWTGIFSMCNWVMDLFTVPMQQFCGTGLNIALLDIFSFLCNRKVSFT
jgi:hypothetical protein